MPRMRSAVAMPRRSPRFARDLESVLPQHACLIVCKPVERNHRQRAQHLRLGHRIPELAARVETLPEVRLSRVVVPERKREPAQPKLGRGAPGHVV